MVKFLLNFVLLFIKKVGVECSHVGGRGMDGVWICVSLFVDLMICCVTMCVAPALCETWLTLRLPA